MAASFRDGGPGFKLPFVARLVRARGHCAGAAAPTRLAPAEMTLMMRMPPPQFQAIKMTSTHERTLPDIAQALRRAELTSLHLTEAAIRAHDATEPRLHAWKTWAPEAARARARLADEASRV